MPTANLLYTTSDADGDKFPVSVDVFLSNLDSLSDIYTNQIAPLWAAIFEMTTGRLEAITMTVNFNDQIGDLPNNVATALSDIQEKCKFIFRVDGNPTFFRMTIPTFRENLFTRSGAGKVLDLTDGDVQAFITLMTNSVPNGGVNACDVHSYGLISLKSAYQWFGQG